MREAPFDAHRPLETAQLDWDSDGQPLSRRFEDVYFSREDGLAETRHVFIDGNRLPQRWSALSVGRGGSLTTSGRTFTIGETGFGTGLNFLLAASLWLQQAPPQWRLHFVSAERFPLTVADFRHSLSLWPELTGPGGAGHELGRELADQWPLPTGGYHRRTLAGGRVALTLLYGDACAGFQTLADDSMSCRQGEHFGVDAWFLDGFAPARNGAMWTAELYRALARLSHANTTVATFTAAGHVRRGLNEAGFAMTRAPGFGRKREMLTGRMTNGPAPDHAWRETPWFVPARAPDTAERRAVIVGAGIAGCATAAALARRDWQVTLIDAHPHPGAEASGNPQGILYPRLSHGDGLLPRFALQALLHSQAVYTPFWQGGGRGERCGVLLLPDGEDGSREFSRLADRFADTGLLTRLQSRAVAEAAGVPLAADDALLLPHSGWVSPPEVCRWLTDHPNIAFLQARVNDLQQDDNDRWRLWSEGREVAAAPVVVLANAAAAAQFSRTSDLPLRVIRGQVSILEHAPVLAPLKTVLCGKGYLAPVMTPAGEGRQPGCQAGYQTLGATYDLDDTDLTPRRADHRRNLDTLAATDGALRALLESSEPESWQARVALRCTAPDYLPLIGPMPDRDRLLEDYADLRRDARRVIATPGANVQGLYLHCALGSRGLTYAPLGAEYLADLIDGQLPALSTALQQAIHPARFLVRDLKKNRV